MILALESVTITKRRFSQMKDGSISGSLIRQRRSLLLILRLERLNSTGPGGIRITNLMGICIELRQSREI